MFKVEKLSQKAVITVYGFVGGYYLDYRNVSAALEDVSMAGYSKLDFRIHTYGGTVFDGNLIYNFIAGFKGEVDIYIDGVAASMGSVIIMAGVRIHIAENGFIMIHCPQGGSYGTAKVLIQGAKLLTSMEKNFKQKVLTRTGRPAEEVDALFDGTDHWFDADEAIAWKLADDKFSAKVANIPALNSDEASQLGAQAVYDRYTAALTTEHQIPKNKMNKEDLIKRYALTGVTAQSTDEEVLAAIDAKIKAGNDTAKAVTTKAIEASVDKAIEEKKITTEQRASYVARGEKLGIEELNAVLGDIKAYQPITSQLHQGGPSAQALDRKGWTWNDYQSKAPRALEEMTTKDPKTFKALYREEFGVEPEI
ncbi:head maturation protease, ClpP-related [Williamwhitmania taraxaci]|uniref:ATP-dependent Clp protease proteolytic subunit n=1 Tax=Williamwhitmania taraxaci TaxID=1640674 RepID=A0A1G6MBL2_9BACT|nr:head maturation protease, ClpP-related [Williamwhitmania taraxaci]SDC52840.1 ATP-dependent protease ClpP, protease subunit [Williamwhitmania taraxaci]